MSIFKARILIYGFSTRNVLSSKIYGKWGMRSERVECLISPLERGILNLSSYAALSAWGTIAVLDFVTGNMKPYDGSILTGFMKSLKLS